MSSKTFLPLFALLALPLASGAAAQWDDFSKAEIKAQVIAPGIAVLTGPGGNIGVSYGTDGTVLIDDQFAPLTDRINAAVAGLGATPVRYLINTHWHFDHAGGNEPMGKAGATIFAHDQVRVRLAAGGTVAGFTSPPAPPAALPVVTYNKGITFHLNGDTVDAVFLGGGHTDGDTVVYWRKANVMHMGDLMMKDQGFPFIDLSSGGNAAALIRTLDRALAMTNPATTIIPGHGPVSTQADLRAWRNMIAAALETVRKARAGKQTLEQFLKANPFAAQAKPDDFISADAFATSLWRSLDRPAAPPRKR